MVDSKCLITSCLTSKKWTLWLHFLSSQYLFSCFCCCYKSKSPSSHCRKEVCWGLKLWQHMKCDTALVVNKDTSQILALKLRGKQKVNKVPILRMKNSGVYWDAHGIQKVALKPRLYEWGQTTLLPERQESVCIIEACGLSGSRVSSPGKCVKASGISVEWKCLQRIV